MSTTYTKDDGAVAKAMKAAMKQHHVDLVKAGVTVEILVASNPEGHAVKLHGWPAAALAKVNSLKDRAAGLADARIIVDSDWWEKHSSAERDALLDHELEHFQLQLEKNNEIKRDDLERPKLSSRQHDWEVGGFDCIVKRHGANAPEAHAAAQIKRRLVQLEIDWDQAETASAGSEPVAA